MDFLKDLSIDKVRNLAEDTLNQVKPKTDVEARVYEVLSHKNWGSSSSLMHEIARDTRDMERFHVVTRLMWDGMENQRPAAWRVVFKALTLLEFLVKNGAERCVDDARNHGHVLRALGQFNYYEGTVDRGVGVREKSKQLLEILGDDERIREERQKARKLREKFKGTAATAASPGMNSGYGGQDSWNTGSGYGDGGIDSGYDNGGGFSGRYGGSGGGPSASPAAASTPTFASIPDEKKKKSKKKGMKKKATPDDAAAPPAAQPEFDLFSFDSPPAPAPAPAGNDDFGAFQSTSAPVPAPVQDDFADFGSLRSAPASQPAAPFAAAPTPPPQQQQQSFDAFGNMASASVGMNSSVMGSGNYPNNAMGGNSGMAAMNNAFGNMNMGMQQPPQQPVSTPALVDDEFGDFAAAAPTRAPPANPADPMAKLVSLDHLSKNPNQKKPTGFGQPTGQGNNNNNGNNSQFMQNQQSGNVMAQQPVMVSAGGSDAISSMMGPLAAQPKMPQAGMGGQQQQNSPQKMGMQQGMGGQQTMGNQGGMSQMGGMQGNMGMGGMQGNMGMGGMGGMQGNMGMGGMGGMQGNTGMGGMGGMGGMQGNMGMGGMQGNMMGNQMGGMQGNMGMGGMQGNMGMGGMQGNMGMGGMPGNMGMGGMQGNMGMGGMQGNMGMGGMQGNMGMGGMQGNMGGQQWR